MFIENKYTQWYHSIISNRKANPIVGYSEKHHIIPKCLGGSNDKDNLVRLTAREHFICHQLLVKMTTGDAKRKMAFAFWRQINGKHGFKISSKQYETLRLQVADNFSKLNSFPKTESHKQNMRGKRPNFIQTGKKNNAWKGYNYVTPWGEYSSISEAVRESGVGTLSETNLIRICKKPKTKMYKKNPFGYPGGVSYEDVGFGMRYVGGQDH